MITKDEAEVILKVNTEDSRKEFDELEKKAASLRKKFEEAYRVGDTKAIREISTELNTTNRRLNNMRVNAANIRAALTDIDKATPAQLHRTIARINAELGSGRVKRGTKEWEFYTAQLRAVRAELRQVSGEMQVTEGFLSRMNSKFNDWGTSIATGVAAFAGVTMAGKAAVQAYADMEAEEANVMKFTGMTADEVRKLNDEFKRMDTRTSREELNRLAQEAGRLGKTTQEDVLGFVRASDQINVALDELGYGATLELSKLTNIFGDEKVLGTEKALLSVGSVINELSQNCTAGASYMVDYAQRMAGVGAQAGMTIPQIMSYAAVLDSQGQNVEASATAMSQLIMKMYQDPAKIAKAAGMDVKEFSDILKKDANEALIMLLKTLNSYGGIEKLASIFDEMGTDGARASAAIAALAGNVDMLVWEQSEANRAFREATSVTKEYEVQNNTVQAKLDKARKKFNELAVDLGEKLLPVMQYCISGTSMLMRVMNVLIDFFAEHRKEILTTVSAVIAYNTIIAVHNKSVSIATKWTNLWTAAQKGFTTVSNVFRLCVVAGTNSVQYFTNGLQVNYAMQQRWRKAMSAMSLGGWVGLIVAAGSAVYYLYDKISNVDAETRKYNKSLLDAVAKISNFDGEIRKEKEELDKLFGALDAAKKGTDEYTAAKQALISSYGDYISDLVDEKGHITDLSIAYDRLAGSIRLANLERNIQSSRESVETSYYERMEALTKELYDTLIDYGVSVREASKLSTQISTSLNLGLDLDSDTIARINEISSGKRRTVDGKNDPLTKLSYNLNLMFGDAPLQPSEIVNRMFDTITNRNSAIKTIDSVAREGHPLRDLPDNMLETAITYAEEAVKNGGGSVMRVLDAMAGTFEMVDADMEEARSILEQLRSEKYYRAGGITKEESSEIEPPAPFLGESKADRKAREKAEREAKKRQREEEAEAKRILKQHLEDVKAARLQEEAVNLAAYTSGQRNFLEYTEAKAKIEDDYIEKSLKVLEDHGKKDSETYAKLLKQREELTRQSAERQRKASLFDVEQDHERKSDSIVSNYFDPSGPVFQNQKALDQALLEEDIRYLTAKRDLYDEGSDEWIKLDAEIGKRIAKDQLDKQKETAAAYLSFVEQYRLSEGSIREQMELQILEDLHNKGLISEEEYQKAVSRIKKKYRDEDLEKFYEAANEYDGMILHLYEAFKDLFDNLGDHGEEFWSRLAKSGEAAFAVMGAMMSQYSAYSNAERDLELAKIEKRYDTEIKAAGSNTKKVQQLEEQKEKEIAKVKTKYNDRAMKLEIAQAIAQTATNALGAYGAMVKIPVVGPALAAAAAAMATAAGMIQVATIRKQHQAEAAGYYAGGYTKRDPDDRREVGVVHANEFVANHHAVAHPVLSPILNLIDHAQRTNTVGSITAEDVSNAIGATSGVSLRGGDATGSPDRDMAVAEAISSLSVVSAENREAIRELSRLIEEGIPAYVPMDGEKGFHRQYVRYMKMLNNPKR